jgi:hypothetical protein
VLVMHSQVRHASLGGCNTDTQRRNK